jgi:polygalacturonase
VRGGRILEMTGSSCVPPAFTRRVFLRSAGAVVLAWPLAGASDPWTEVPAILGRIKPPEFPDRQFDITRYGARGDGVTDCTQAIAQAIAECSRAGGGRVVAPAGDFLTGAVHLRSRVDLHLSAGATLRFSQNPRRYLPVVFTRWEGVECMNYSPFVYAYGQQDVAVTGPGILDGQAGDQHWWPWCGNARFGWKAGDPAQPKARAALFEMGEKDVPVDKRVFGEGSYLRPNFLQFYRCQNVLVEDVTLHNSPMWQVHPVLSSNVMVRRVKPTSLGPNNDGCNPECCWDVLIEDCQFDTGDDCIAIKSGRNRDGRRVATPSENIIVRGCQMKDGHGGVTVGSEASGGVRNVFAENCRMDSPNLDRALRLKTNSVRGGFIEHIYMRNVTVGQVADAVLQVDLFYEEGDKGNYPPVVRDIEMRNVTSRKSTYALYLRGYKSDPIRDVRLIDCVFDNVAKPDVVENVEGLSLVSVRVNGRPLR